MPKPCNCLSARRRRPCWTERWQQPRNGGQSRGENRLLPFVSRRLVAAGQTAQHRNFHVVFLIGKFQGHLQIVEIVLGAKLKSALAILKDQRRINVGSPFAEGLQVREG